MTTQRQPKAPPCDIDVGKINALRKRLCGVAWLAAASARGFAGAAIGLRPAA